MMFWGKRDPGPCPVDDAPHTTCTSPDYVPPIVIVQLPMRDAAIVTGEVPLPTPPPEIPTPATTFTTATYRGKRRRV